MKSEKFPQPKNSFDDSKNELLEIETSRTQETAQSYEIFKDPEERYFLVDVADNFIDQIRSQKNLYDAFVFFDRGARLFGHLIRERWKHRFPEDKIPDIFFVKIGREMGQPSLDPNQPVEYEYPWKNIFERDWNDKLPSVGEIIDRVKDNFRFKKIVRNLRKSFLRGDKAIFDGKKILLVDEFMASGGTLSYGKALFSRAFKDANIDGAGLVARFKNYPEGLSVIKPISGERIPSTLGDPDFAGVNVPSPPSKEYRDKFFIKPKYLGPLQEKIEVIENNIAMIEERVKKIPDNEKVKKKKRDWGIDFIAHPLIDKLSDLKYELKQTQEGYDNVKERMERYRQARNEIHSIAVLD